VIFKKKQLAIKAIYSVTRKVNTDKRHKKTRKIESMSDCRTATVKRFLEIQTDAKAKSKKQKQSKMSLDEDAGRSICVAYPIAYHHIIWYHGQTIIMLCCKLESSKIGGTVFADRTADKRVNR